MNKYSIYLNGVFMAIVKVPPGLGARTKVVAIETWNRNPVVLTTYGNEPYTGPMAGAGFKLEAKATRRK